MTTEPRKAMRTWLLRVLSLSLALAVSSCSLFQYRNAQSPKVSVTQIALSDFSIFEQRFDVGLRLQNPNDFELPITGFEYALNLNGQEFASGVNATNVTVPALGEAQVTVTLNSDLLNSIERLRRWQREGSQSLDYELKGRLRLANVPFRLPFKYAGKVDLRLR